MAFYRKPKNVSWTDMCIFIDNYMSEGNFTEDGDNKVFEYLCILINMLARKQGYFKNSQDYEDFAMYMATSTYFRLKNPKINELDDDGNPKLEPIKSVLNYVKATLYPRKVNFEQEYYAQVLTSDEEDNYDQSHTFGDMVEKYVDELDATEFELCLGDICKTIKAFVKKLPYRKDRVMSLNIYLSCLMTLLNSVTLTNKDKVRIMQMRENSNHQSVAIDLAYEKEKENPVILYHLDESMKDYIYVVTQEMRSVLSKDLSMTFHTYIPTSATYNKLTLAELNGEDMGDY